MNGLNGKSLKGIISLVLIIIVVSALARSLKGSETLAQYASEHPEEQVKPEITAVVEEVAVPATEEKEVEMETTVTPIIEEPVAASFTDEYEGSDERVIYKEGFFYEPVPAVIRDKMKGVSYPLDIDESKVNFDSLRYLNVLYVDFDGNSQNGEIVCNEAIAQDLVEIFYELYQADYRLESVKLIDEFDADDVASMSANNTSCFCYRVVANTTNLSNHAYGLAIDINPFYNPYIVFKEGEDDYVSPPGSEIYVDRSEENDNPYRIDKNDLAYRLFKEHGFRWGGDWNSSKDYQHFDKKQ